MVQLTEQGLIRYLQAESQGFIGDDAATLPVIPSHYLVSKDLLIEDIHFRLSYYSPEDLAHKALHVNLSDIAAMGGEPLYLLCGIAIPPHLHSYANSLLVALTHLCKQLGLILIGGDTTASTTNLVVSITVIGKAFPFSIRSRQKANPNDIICVAGNLGYAHLGLLSFESSLSHLSSYRPYCLRPEARLREGRWLGSLPFVTALMDISDGLYLDLTKLCEASQVGATLHTQSLTPWITQDLTLSTLLEGGEDYGLLMCVSPQAITALMQDFQLAFGYPLKRVGVITASLGVEVDTPIPLQPFYHFNEG